MKKKKIDYTNWSKDELVKELKRIKETTYGLVWHRDVPHEKIDVLINPDARTPAEMFANEVAGKPFPVLKEVKNKEIVSNKDDQTHILIEGDNYHSLAVLNFTHQEAVDVIYIDPPYNTGKNDFIYTDNFKSGYVDKEDPFRHSKWLSFIEKRIKLAKNLLKKTGIIFISIDDNEQAPLKMLCDEIFGERNFVGILPRLTKKGGKSSGSFSKNNDYVLVYFNSEDAKLKSLEHDDIGFKYKDDFEQERGLYKLNQTLDYNSIQYSKSLDYKIVIDGEEIRPGGVSEKEMSARIKKNPDRDFCWRWSKKLFEFGLENDFIVVKKYKNKLSRIYTKTYQNATISKDLSGDYFIDITPRTKTVSSINLIDNKYSNDIAKKELKNLFGGDIKFDYPKPASLVEFLLKVSTNKNSTVVDFMAGTGTTGHAVLDLNKEDGGSRKFILCTNDENNIATDVCQPRLKKVIKGYKNSNGEKVEGLGGNLKYFTAYDFVESEQTDKNKRKLVKKSAEMICIKENIFDLVTETKEYKIFKNTNDKYLGIIFYDEAIDKYKKAIKTIDQKINTYVFSLNDDPHTKEFADMKDKVVLQPIPEVILKVYQEIFK